MYPQERKKTQTKLLLDSTDMPGGIHDGSETMVIAALLHERRSTICKL